MRKVYRRIFLQAQLNNRYRIRRGRLVTLLFSEAKERPNILYLGYDGFGGAQGTFNFVYAVKRFYWQFCRDSCSYLGAYATIIRSILDTSGKVMLLRGVLVASRQLLARLHGLIPCRFCPSFFNPSRFTKSLE